MNNLSAKESASRAMSHFRYWKHRRDMGKPISMLGTIRDAIARFWFEFRAP